MARMSLQQFETRLRNWAQTTPATVRTVLKRLAMEVIGYTQRKRLTGPRMPRGTSGGFFGSTLGVRTGILRRSLMHRVSVSASKVTAQIGTNIKYAPIHEFGGIIKPKTKKALRFQIDGDWVTVKQVRMPERPFLRPSVQEERPRVRQEILQAHVRGWKHG